MRSVTRLRRNPCISSIGGRNTITATTGGRYEQEASRLQVSDLSLRPVRHECARLGIAHPHSSAKSRFDSGSTAPIYDGPRKRSRVMAHRPGYPGDKMSQAIRYPRGSEWRRWDLHVHTPFSALNNGFGADFDIYARELLERAVAAEIAVVGITDYFGIPGYRELKELIADTARLVALVGDDVADAAANIRFLPNVELRARELVQAGDGGSRVNFHVISRPCRTRCGIPRNDPGHGTPSPGSTKCMRAGDHRTLEWRCSPIAPKDGCPKLMIRWLPRPVHCDKEVLPSFQASVRGFLPMIRA